MEEIWKEIEDTQGKYQISNTGKVRNSLTKKERKQRTDRYNYKYLIVKINGRQKLLLIHRLVAKAFIPNPNNYRYVNHIDENKSNNIESNLEWCTAKYNCNYGSRNNRISDSKCKPVIQYSLDGKIIKEWHSIDAAANYYNVNRGAISACCRKVKYCHTAYGYKWEYKKGGA